MVSVYGNQLVGIGISLTAASAGRLVLETGLFWNHKWLDVGCLSDLFPDIFAIAADKNALVSDYSLGSGVDRVWNVRLRRNLTNWELDSFYVLMEILYSIKLEDFDDVLSWNHSKNSLFTVKSFYSFLQGGEIDDFPWKKLWQASIPPRVIFFSWCAVRGRILTMDNLKRRGYCMVNRCPLCHRQEESIDHVFIHCNWSADLWRLILACFGVHFCFPDSFKNFLLSWWGQYLDRRKKKIWNVVPFCLCWLIWKERNRRIFDNIDRTVLSVKSLFLRCLFSWVEEGKDLDINSFFHFLASMH